MTRPRLIREVVRRLYLSGRLNLSDMEGTVSGPVGCFCDNEKTRQLFADLYEVEINDHMGMAKLPIKTAPSAAPIPEPLP